MAPLLGAAADSAGDLPTAPLPTATAPAEVASPAEPTTLELPSTVVNITLPPSSAKQPVKPILALSTAPAPAADTEPLDNEANSPSNGEFFDLVTLFAANPTSQKKTVTARLTDYHHRYLLTLGTILGNGMSPLELLYNLVQQLIDTQDTAIQKASSKCKLPPESEPVKSRGQAA